MIGRIIDNLNAVLGTVDERGTRAVDTLIAELQRFVSGLAADREAIGASLDQHRRPGRRDRRTAEGRPAGDPGRRQASSATVAGNAGRQQEGRRRASLQRLPDKLDTHHPDRHLRLLVQLLPLRLRGPRDPVEHDHVHAELPLVGCEVQLTLRKVPARRGRSTPFRERNPVVIGAVGLGRDRRHAAAARSTSTSCRCWPASRTRPPLRGRRAQGRRRRTDRRGQGRQGDGGRPGGEPRPGRLPGRPVDRAGLADLGARSGSRPSWGRSTWPWSPRARASWPSEIPLSPDDTGVRRGRGVQRPRHHHRGHRHRPARDRARHGGEHLPGLARRRPRRDRRARSRLSRTVASRDAQLRELLHHANGVTGVLADRNKELVSLLTDGDLLLQELRKRRADIHTLLVSTVTLSAAADRAGPGEPRGDRPGPGQPEGRARRRWRPTRRTSTGASGCWRRSSGCSPTPPATAGGSTPTSRTCVPVPGGPGSAT